MTEAAGLPSAATAGSAAAMLRAASLAALRQVRHAFFARGGGVSGGLYASLNGGAGSDDAPAAVAENRARMAAALGVAPHCLVTAYQVHSPDAVVVDRPWTAQERPRADAIVTRTPGLAVGVTTADCGPVLLADEAAGVVGAAHAGWRGAATGVLEATIAAMERCGARRERIVAALGPMIRQPNYEVGPEFVARFEADDPANARFFRPSPRPDHGLFDLPGYIAARLAAAGIGAIEDLGPCTYGDETRFFSYRRSVHRREPDYGRHISAIALAS
jgi:polyphenol oxidase